MAKRKPKPNAPRRYASHENRGTRIISTVSRALGKFSLASWQPLALILVGGFILHMSALAAPFFADDYVFLDRVRFQSLSKTLFSQDPLGNFFRPVGRQLYFWLTAHVSNESPVFFHSINLVLFLACLALLFFIAKRLAGPMAGAVAGGILAVHYAIDLPILWASGSQDLLALTGALAAIHLFLLRRPFWAALILFSALLCKETVAVTPFVGIILVHVETRSWRRAVYRAVPLFVTLIPWAVLWLSFGSRQVAPGVELTLNTGGVVATFVQLVRVTFGLEWVTGKFGSQWAAFPPILALLPIVIAVLLTQVPSGTTRPSPVAGLGWALLGALPVASVARVWSAYYYVFALAGVALALGTWATRFPRWVAVVLIVVVAWTSQGARQIDKFATGPGAWTAQSHMNSWWFNRGAFIVKWCLRDLKRAHPTVPSGSTFFFFDIPEFTIWHSGPLVRWTYHDDSLRGYYLREFSLDKAHQGPVFYFRVQRGQLVEAKPDEALSGMGLGAILKGNLELAHDVLLFEAESKLGGPATTYCLAFVEWAQGDKTSAINLLTQIGVSLHPGPTPELFEAETLARSSQIDQAISLVLKGISRNGLDPDAQGMLADLLVAKGGDDPRALLAAFVSRTLDPTNPRAWRRWGMIQYHFELYPEAKKSLERYFSLGGDKAQGDKQAWEVLKGIQGFLGGGEHIQTDARADADGEP
jgi:hypothetical protein